jgi:hypothetical protein
MISSCIQHHGLLLQVDCSGCLSHHSHPFLLCLLAWHDCRAKLDLQKQYFIAVRVVGHQAALYLMAGM